MSSTEESVAKQSVTPRQLLMILGALVLVLILVWFFLLRGGGAEEPDPLAIPLPDQTTEPFVEPTLGPDDNDKNDPVETFEVFARRDPFDPLIDLSPNADGGDGDGTDGGDGGDGADPNGDGTDPDGDGDGDGDGTNGNDPDGGPGGDNGNGPGDGGGQNIDGHTVRLIDVFVDGGETRAQVQVDGSVYTVDEGEVFAENFKLLSASGNCATMLFGDDQFTLCEGEEILK